MKENKTLEDYFNIKEKSIEDVMDDEEEWIESPMRTEEEIFKYLNEACDKVWYMRSHPCDNPEIEKGRLKAIKRVEKQYPEVKDGFNTWDCGFWNGVLGTLRWVLGEEEKDMLDT